MDSILVLAACIFVPMGVGMANSFATQKSIREWYPTIRKPPWTPPNWLFAPVWTVLYVMMGWAMWLVLRSDASSTAIWWATGLWVLQLTLNAFWSPAFFGRRDPPGALKVLFVMDVAIIANIWAFATISTLSAALMLPYLAWGLFATALNIRVVQLNDWPEASGLG
jgi:tryptophan-rich sensory protein